MKTVDNIVFFSSGINIRAGGPSGYIANLKSAIQESEIKNDIVFITGVDICFRLKIIKFFSRVLGCLIVLPKLRRQFRDKFMDCFKTRLFYNILDKYKFKTITTHIVDDTIFIRKYIESRRIKSILLQMSHSPQPPSQEIYEHLVACGDTNAEKIYEQQKKLEYDAFSSADMYIFPSPESVECYDKPLKYFNQLTKTRQIKYVRTGCRPLQTEKTRDEMREFYNIKTPFVITYIGRHNKIKGYDVLQNIAKEILKKRDDVTFLIGGRPGEIPALQHSRWIELGQINPAEVLVASDLFILPNRQTYFDLILLEVLSAGIPVIASNTGGNKTVFSDTGVITLYNNEKDCVKKILKTLDSFSDKRSYVKKNIQKAWADNYSPKQFAKNYIYMIQEVCNDQ